MALVLALMPLAGFFPATQANAAEVRTAAGSNALVFAFSGLGNLGLSDYKGGLGFRHYIGDRLALRPGIVWSWSWQKTRPDPVPPGQSVPGDTREIDTSVGLNLAIEKHLAGPKSVSPYLGAGAEGIYHNNKSEPGVAADAPPGTLTKITDRGWSAGVFGLLGFEWGFAELITLGGEYRFSFRAGANVREKEFRESPDQPTDDTASFASDFSTSSIYLSVGF